MEIKPKETAEILIPVITTGFAVATLSGAGVSLLLAAFSGLGAGAVANGFVEAASKIGAKRQRVGEKDSAAHKS